MIIYRKFLARVFVKAGVMLFFTLITGFTVNAQQNPLRFSHLTVDNGLSHTDATQIKQDKHGFIWIATLFGLDRYDGNTIKRFYNTNVPKHNSLKNRIISMCLDENDRIWLGTEDGIQFFDPRSEKYTDVDNIQHNTGSKIYDRIFALKGNRLGVFVEGQPRLFSVKGKLLTDIPLKYPQGISFTDMIPDQNGNIWLTSNKGVLLLDPSYRFGHFDIGNGSGGSFPDPDRVFINRRGQLLITRRASIVLIKNQNQGPLPNGGPPVLKLTGSQQTTIPGRYILDMIQDKDLNYWVCTNAGLFLLDSAFNTKKTISIENTVNGLNAKKLGNLFVDRSECLWVCTWGNGVNIGDLNAKPFHTLQHSDNPNSLSGNYIRSIIEESGRKVWIGTDGQGLNEYDLQTQNFKHYNTESKPIKLKSNIIQALALDNEHNLWIGSDHGLDIINHERNNLWRPADYETFPSDPIASIAIDYYGNIWFGSFSNGFGSIIHNKKKVYKVKYHGSASAYLIWADREKPELFISGTHGLLRVIIDSAGDVVKTFSYTTNNKPNSLSSDYVFQVQKQNDSTYWIGTLGGGLDRLLLKKNNTYSVATYSGHFGIFNDVETNEFDYKGNTWMGGNGLERFNLNSKKLTRFDKNDGLQGNSFKINASCRGKNGRLYFGGVNGLSYFFPDSIKTNQVAALPVFADLLINNKKVIIDSGQTGNGENTIEKSITYSNAVHLSYLQNNFVISFSAMHYANPQKCQYRYKLVGFDKEWRSTDGNNPTASYSNLDYDDYSLIVEATNNDGVWSKDKAVISITVAPPWWKSTIAKAIYLLLILSVLIGIYIYQARWFRLKRELSIRQLEEKKQEELYQQQLKLTQQIQEKNKVLQEADEFKNKLVSILAHDFRAPLSSTISIARMMRDNQGITEEEMELFYSDIENDATKMLESFDTILQWIRQQLSGYQFKAETLKLHDLFRESAALFQLQLDSKKITFSNQVPEHTMVISDKEMLQFVNRNLLSNAIKFSPEGGRIIIGCTKNATEFTVTVADDGPGMSEATLNKLFSISSQAGHSTQMGAGIALSMCRDFIKKLDGRIWAENKEPNGVILYYTIPSESIIS